MTTSFSGGGCRRESPTVDKQLVNFIICDYESEPPTLSKQLVNFVTCSCESSAKTPQRRKKSTHSRAKTPKLLGTLNKKPNYVCHYRNLQLYLQLGMKIKKDTQNIGIYSISISKGIRRTEYKASSRGRWRIQSLSLS